MCTHKRKGRYLNLFESKILYLKVHSMAEAVSSAMINIERAGESMRWFVLETFCVLFV